MPEPSEFEITAREIRMRALALEEANQRAAQAASAAEEVLTEIEVTHQAEDVERQNDAIASWALKIRESGVRTAELLKELNVPSQPSSWREGPLTRIWRITDAPQTRHGIYSSIHSLSDELGHEEDSRSRLETGYALTWDGEIVVFRQRNPLAREGDDPWPVIDRVAVDEQLVPRWTLNDNAQPLAQNIDLWSERLLNLFDTGRTEEPPSV